MKKSEKYPVAVYSRVVGYLSPIREWNNGKQEEFKDRREYSGQGQKRNT